MGWYGILPPASFDSSDTAIHVVSRTSISNEEVYIPRCYHKHTTYFYQGNKEFNQDD
jgi:hypothetical protein